MSKNSLVIAIVAVSVVVALFVAMQDEAVTPKTTTESRSIEHKVAKPQMTEEEEQVAELKKKAGVATVETSQLYKTRCASCHGYSGEGIVGPQLVGMSESQVLKSLVDYKADRVPNSLMRGLLNNSTDEELAMLAKEISKF